MQNLKKLREETKRGSLNILTSPDGLAMDAKLGAPNTNEARKQ